MNILFIANWRINFLDKAPKNIMPSDYCSKDEKFWFFKYFKNNCKVEVIDITSNKIIMRIEEKIRFVFHYIFKIFKNRNKYDLLLFHGTNGAILFLMLKRIFKIKTPPIVVVDISSFHKADTSGIIFKLCRYASKEIDYLIYHASSQIEYFKQYFPWLVDKSKFIPIGVDYDYWNNFKTKIKKEDYCICVGYRKRDWNTLIEAYSNSNIKEKLYLIGNNNIEVQNDNIKILPFIPINELMEYLISAKFSIVPLDDYNYSFGQLTILQQMAVGIPIITSNVPAVKDYINYGEGVLKYKSHDINDLKNKLENLSNYSKEQINKMKVSNKEVIRNILNEKNMAQEFENVINQILEEKNAK